MPVPLYSKKIRKKGRGVFSSLPIPADSLIEECPVLIIPQEEADRIRASSLSDYLFRYDEEGKRVVLAMGFGSLYNHATHSNACYQLDREAQLLRIYSIKAIRAGEEICINYGAEPGKDYREWFEARGMKLVE